MDLEKELQRLGLSQKESAVYLAALRLGSASAGQLAEASRVNRATTYLCLEALASRGLISEIEKDGKRLFVGETPERILSLIRFQREELDTKQQQAESVIPFLLALQQKDGTKPHVRYFEGKEGMLAVRELFLGLEGEFVQVVPYVDAREQEEIAQNADKHLGDIEYKEIAHRVLLVVDNPKDCVVPRLSCGEVCLVSKEEFPLQSEITVRANHVFLFSYDPTLLSVVLEDASIARALKGLFDLAWKSVKKTGKTDGYLDEKETIR
jgi:sugar-specific transcriptional regulator TrmB